MRGHMTLKAASAFWCCAMCLPGPIAKAQQDLAIPTIEATAQAPSAEAGRAMEAARNAQSIARQIAEKAVAVAKRADDLAVSARKAGPCVKAENRTGLVAICADDGARYYGEMKDGRFQGLGVFVFANGYMTKGEWQRGEPEGLAVTISETGYVIEGEMRAGKPNGYGISIGNFGRYEGQWKDGDWNGFGVELTRATVLEGEWHDGHLQR
jgi:hypothetical protein